MLPQLECAAGNLTSTGVMSVQIGVDVAGANSEVDDEIGRNGIRNLTEAPGFQLGLDGVVRPLYHQRVADPVMLAGHPGEGVVAAKPTVWSKSLATRSGAQATKARPDTRAKSGRLPACLLSSAVAPGMTTLLQLAPVLLGVLTGLLSTAPLLGTAFIWVPLGVGLIVVGHTWKRTWNRIVLLIFVGAGIG